MADIPIALLRLLIEIIKHQVKLQLGDNASALLAQALVSFAGDNVEDKLGSFLTQEGNVNTVFSCFKEAEDCFVKSCGNDSLIQAVRSLPLAGLDPTKDIIQSITKTLDSDYLSQSIQSLMETSWGSILSKDEIAQAVPVYKRCLENSLAGKGDHLLKVLFIKVDEIVTNLLDVKGNTQKIIEAQLHLEDEFLHPFIEISKFTSAYPSNLELTVELESEYKAQLDEAKKFIDKHFPKQAISYLESLKARIWDKSNREDKYKILSYLGFSHLALNENKKAATYLIEAFQFAPDNAKACSNAGVGYLVLGDFDKSILLANKSLAIDPTCIQAYSVIIQSQAKKEKLEDIVQKIPEIYREKYSVSLALGFTALSLDRFNDAEVWLRTALRVNEDPMQIEHLGALADALLLQTLKNDPPLSLKGFKTASLVSLQEVIQILDIAWNAVARTDMRNYKYGWLTNRAIAKQLIGDFQGAENDAQEVVREAPDQLQAVKLLSAIAYQKQDFAKAASLTRKLVGNASFPDAKFALALILFLDEKLDEAKEILEGYLEEVKDSPHLYIDGAKLLIDTLIKEGKLGEAHGFSELLINQFPESPEILTVCSKVARLNGEYEEANRFLNDAENKLASDMSLTSYFWVADELMNTQKFDKAAAILSRITDTSINSSLTRQLVYCYFRAGKLDESLTICKNLRKEYGALQFFTEIESAICEEIGDLPSSKEICKQYLASFPDNIEVRLRLACLNYRMKEFRELDEYLEGEIPFERYNISGLKLLITLYRLRERTKEAIRLAYFTRRKFFNDPSTHLAYASLIFSLDETTPQEWLHPDKVTVDTAVDYEETRTKNKNVFIVESGVAEVLRNEYRASHGFIKPFLNKMVGDKVEHWDTLRIKKEEYVITNIRSKFIYALHEIMETYPTMFYDTPGIMRFNVDTTQDLSNDPKWLQPIFDVVDKRYSKISEVQKLYKNGFFPIGAVANLLGLNPIEVQADFSSNPEVGLLCASGRLNDMQIASSLDFESLHLVIDILDVITINQLMIGDLIINTIGKPIVSQSNIDLLVDELSNPLRNKLVDRFSIGKEGSQYTKFFISKEVQEHNIRFLEANLKWIEKNCEILPVHKALSINRDFRDDLNEKIGMAFIDTILLSAEENRVLFSDDKILRDLASSSFQVKGIWTQPLLKYFNTKNLITDEEYDQNLIKLILLNYYPIHITDSTLLESARMADWHPRPPFITVAKCLSGKCFDEESCSIVGANFIKKLWAQRLLPFQYEQLFYSILNSLTEHREDPRIILSKFSKRINEAFALSPIDIDENHKIMKAWMMTHPLIVTKKNQAKIS